MPGRKKGLQHTLQNNSGAAIWGLSVFVLAASLLVNAKHELRSRDKASEEPPPLYLPEARYVKLVTFGFDNFAADVLWFNTINYFGKQYLENKDYRWFAHMCELVTTLDPQAIQQYEFCGTLLSWVVKDPKASNKLLSRAIQHHPAHWRFYYQRGFNYWYFLNNQEKAKQEFLRASQIPNAPDFLVSLASRLMVETESPGVAIAFLKDMLEHAKDKLVREALQDKLKRAYISRDIRLIESVKNRYEKEMGNTVTKIEQLVAPGYLKFIPNDPFGGSYQLNPDSNAVETTTGEKGLDFFGKTAETGALSHEFVKHE